MLTVAVLLQTGRIDINAPKVCGHSGPVLDIKWNPFNDDIIASCSDDATVRLLAAPSNAEYFINHAKTDFNVNNSGWHFFLSQEVNAWHSFFFF